MVFKIAKHARKLVTLTVLAVAALATGCKSPMGVDRAGPERVYRELTVSALSDDLSLASQQVLHRYNLLDESRRSAPVAIQRLHELAVKDPRRDLLFALAELCYWQAPRAPADPPSAGEARHKRTQQRDYYLAAAIYAYLYLFGHSDLDLTEQYERRFRTACDLYNRALAEAFRVRATGEIVMESGERSLPVGRVRIETRRPNFPWSDRFNRFQAADDYKVRGFKLRHRDEGVGVPLIALASPPKPNQPVPDYYPPNQRIPATAFLRVAGDIHQISQGDLTASLELYSAFDEPTVKVGARTVPLEADPTARIAGALEQPLTWRIAFNQFFSGEQAIKSGVYITQPYQPGKIPVVFVHGTAGTPATWAQMFNALMADPELRQRFQFWFFVYNTGNPIPFSAMLLREGIAHVARDLDPEGKDPALRQIVVIGHSQGGLLTKMIATDSGDKVWAAVGNKPLDQMKMSERSRDLLRRVLFFEASPWVSRVIFICTPFHGSYRVTSLVQSLAMRMIRVPRNVASATADLFKENPDALPPELRKRTPTSITGMKPGSLMDRTLETLTIPPRIRSHTIVATLDNAPTLEKTTDGIVAYPSAHRTDVDSEYLVHSGHSCTAHPLTIEEVRRILLLHIAERR
jgi:pimeloyl-ACP methyl ester carboxylesterase